MIVSLVGLADIILWYRKVISGNNYPTLTKHFNTTLINNIILFHEIIVFPLNKLTFELKFVDITVNIYVIIELFVIIFYDFSKKLNVKKETEF